MSKTALLFRAEFDPTNKILLVRVEGRLTDESLAELDEVGRGYWTATDASTAIWDLSSVTQFDLSAEFVCALAQQEPATARATTRLRFIVAPKPVGFGLSRMFQIAGEATRPFLKVVHTLDEALATLGIQSPHFEALQ